MNVDENEEVLQGLNHQIPDGKTGEPTYDEGQAKGHHEEDKVKGAADDARDGSQGLAGLKVPQSQNQTGATVCWERFLHVRSIRVLLVENDDSTRHVVNALLRNCSYEVVEAANGLQAWKILEDLNNQIDIVLTEVVMPYLSGIGLLCKILSHKTRRNIPVIMMSSHDSMGLVFKCLSKGAVDFLVKPIRKNELKNLWQHVWRRCHSSSGSGSESGTQTQKSVKSKSVRKSDNDSGSNDEDDNESIGLNVGYGSSDGSGTQSSWTKQAVEVDSPRPVSAWDRVDSTCAQVIHSNAEVPINLLVAAPAEKEPQELGEKLETAAMGRDLEISFPINPDPQPEPKDEEAINPLENSSSKWKMRLGKGTLDLSGESPSSKLMHDGGGLGFITKSSHLKDSRDSKAPSKCYEALEASETAINNTDEQMYMEHCLKRHRGVKEDGKIIKDDRNVLRRSESSAFSRYNPASIVNKPSSGNMGSNSLHDNCQDITKKGSACDCHSNLNDSLPNHYSHVGSNNIEMSSTTDNALIKPGAPKINCAVSSSVKHSSFQPCLSSQVLPHRCNHSHRVQNAHQKLPHCGSSNVYSEAVNYSVNGSVSGSNHGSNGPNGSSTAVNAGVNMESDNNAGKSGSGDASGSGTGSGSGGGGGGGGSRLDENKISQREAALTKFRQKRKERCFRKKVRYQSRKRLAEQRPRVRGQFVRRTAATDNEDSSKAEDS